MHILAFETSSPRGTIALWNDCGQGLMEDFQSDRSHNSLLFPPLARILPNATELELVAAGTGPGSYTGVRVGLSAALGIAMARNVPVVGIPSITALVHAAAEERYAVCGDAHPTLGSASEIAALTAATSRRIYTTDPASPPFCEATPSWPRADLIALRAASLTEQELARLAAIPPEPIYLHAPFITQSKQPVFLPPP
jgi:tRNA threonylcarbamoyladenosine biosynthesis protein TsaB